MLNLEQLVEQNSQDKIIAIKSLSTSKVFPLANDILEKIRKNNQAEPLEEGETKAIGNNLTPDLFYFKRQSDDHMDRNLITAMPYIVTDKHPALKAAQVNTQVEFDHAFRSVIQEPEYQGKKVLFISGLNVDISPEKGQIFPLTKFIPWAAYHQTTDGKHETWEQAELYERLKAQPYDNPDQVNLENAIKDMEELQEIVLPF